jgi:hypothetical protein
MARPGTTSAALRVPRGTVCGNRTALSHQLCVGALRKAEPSSLMVHRYFSPALRQAASWRSRTAGSLWGAVLGHGGNYRARGGQVSKSTGGLFLALARPKE